MIMAWIPPVEFNSDEYYNFSDLNRVDNNTQYIYDLLLSLGYKPSISGISTSRDNLSLTFYDDFNRIEGNIKSLADNSYVPLEWIEPVLTWVSVSSNFDFNDANRLESNLLALKTMIDNIVESLLFCGDAQTAICGKGNTRF